MTGTTQVNLSFNTQKSIGPNFDLHIINDTFGRNADLYEDVLRVPITATQDEIQVAYFDRRSELFTMLAKIDAAARGPQAASSASLASIDKRRYLAERQMESVVFAVRILADPKLRIAYDKIRSERTGIAGRLHNSGVEYTLQQARSSATTGSSVPISRSNSAASRSSTRSNRNKQHASQEDSFEPETSRSPNESQPGVIASASSASESKNWIKSTFSSPIFSSFSGSKTEDDADDDRKDDEDRNPRKSRRRQKQKQASSHPTRDRDSEVLREKHAEPSTENNKKSIWGRKKRKNIVQQSNPSVNDSIDTNATDLSMTDNEESHMHVRNSEIIEETQDVRPDFSMRSSTSETTGYDGESPHDAVKRGGEQRSINRDRAIVDNDTIDDDDDTTRRDDDTRTFMGDDGETFASASVFSKDYDDDYPGRESCGGAFHCISASKTIKNITDELSGACEDTLVSVDQVFNAFTLTDKDIKAVTKKIHKAKRLLDN
mmetsp:Transcript_16078/g.44476  ORF Transcript_16078/g.44476 Transcript_16078/m.44476 type:complete len:490 (-) Transcript_16078:366-1835(-)|eukprot:CAMPEP_0172368102 /NCGR_PEP_ID=MMETSP1060-20121228/25169_1 /TAXON_ID=37318 /ORGANISM="Pseudo-nitzschia pungens, Strain cf. cingulata" /LENGTH=489 /DNA_ID=CAMNT_0013092579 /DNA_START=235 /DNA_END=1704 /DNA_ORIENTATION=-